MLITILLFLNVYLTMKSFSLRTQRSLAVSLR